MIRLDLEQGTEEWFSARLGIPTASCFGSILTGTGKASTQASKYMHQLLAEWLTREPLGWSGNFYTDRGTELEPEARDYYSFVTDATVEQVGFCLSDDRRFGCSPDGLVGADGGVEIKCPTAAVQVEYLIGGKVPTNYVPQVQGSLFITGRKWWDFISYHPTLPSLLVRVEPDPEYQATLEKALDRFWSRMEEKRELLQKRLEAA